MNIWLLIWTLHRLLPTCLTAQTFFDAEPAIGLSQGELEAIKHDAFFIFNSLLHLLRQWGTTLAPNGFSFTFGTIPAHTLLYHGRKDSSPPASPEWLAFQPQMSLGIMLSNWGETYLRVYSSTRLLKILYIDGMSAALTDTGTLDSQSILLHGKIDTGWGSIWDEYKRAGELCAWAAPLGIEGFVRANAGFELLWCDFQHTTGLELVQTLNVTDWWTLMTGEEIVDPPWGHGPPCSPGGNHSGTPCRLPRWTHRDPSEYFPSWDWLRSATELYAGMGEDRVLLDTSKLITAYGEVGLSHLFTSADMSTHRLVNISEAAVQRYRANIADLSMMKGSGIDWRKIADGLTTRYNQRLPEIGRHLVNGTMNALKTARLVAIGLLMPFVELPANSTHSILTPTNRQRCTRAFTSTIRSAKGQMLSHTEKKLLITIETVHAEICGFVLEFYHAFHDLVPRERSEPPDAQAALTSANHEWKQLAREWHKRLSQLLARLDWKVWRGCRKVCEPNEICYLPVWPLGKRDGQRYPGGPRRPEQPSQFQPVCVDMQWYTSREVHTERSSTTVVQ